MVDLYDYKSMEENIEKLIKYENIRIKLGDNAKQRIYEKFIEQLVIKRLDNLYSKILPTKIKDEYLSI